MTSQLLEQQQRYYDARTQYDIAKAESDRLEKLWRAEEEQLVERMVEANVKSVQFADGSKPTLVKNVSAKCNQGNQAEVRQWLIDTEGDDSDFLKTEADRHKVNAHIKKQIEAGADPEDYPDFLSVSVRPNVRVYGWKNRASE